MITFICQKALHSAKFLPVPKLHFLQLYVFSFSSSSATKSRNSRSKKENQLSFTANYLIENFGFSRERAIIISKQFNFRSSENPDSVVSLFKKHGFSDDQILRVVRKSPAVLKLKPESNLLPKIEFFQSLGMSNDETAKILAAARSLLIRSLDNQIIPSFSFVKNLLKSDEDAIDTIKRFPNILQVNLQHIVPPNAESLRRAGVPEFKILQCLKKYPRFLIIPPDKFRKCVKHIEDMRFNPLKTTFVTGLYVMRMLTRLNWEKKMEVYKRWGYSESQVLAAFRIFPWVMCVSEDKIDRTMDHIVNKMGCDRFHLLGSPQIISLSLEKNIFPRCSVYQILKSKGLIRKNTSLIGFLKYSKKSFIEKFVLCFVEETPELLKLYPQRLTSK